MQYGASCRGINFARTSWHSSPRRAPFRHSASIDPPNDYLFTFRITSARTKFRCCGSPAWRFHSIEHNRLAPVIQRPKIPFDAGDISHADLNMTFGREARIGIQLTSFDKRGTHGIKRGVTLLLAKAMQRSENGAGLSKRLCQSNAVRRTFMLLGNTGGNQKCSRFGRSVIFSPPARCFLEVCNDLVHRWKHICIIGKKR